MRTCPLDQLCLQTVASCQCIAISLVLSVVCFVTVPHALKLVPAIRIGCIALVLCRSLVSTL